jgi:hypothetical protein
MSEKKGSQIKKADLTVGKRLYRNGQRNNVFVLRSIDARPGLARSGFEVELYQDYGVGQKIHWATLLEVKNKFTLLA